jgi:hypothetical protein
MSAVASEMAVDEEKTSQPVEDSQPEQPAKPSSSEDENEKKLRAVKQSTRPPSSSANPILLS